MQKINRSEHNFIDDDKLKMMATTYEKTTLQLISMNMINQHIQFLMSKV